MVILGMVYYRLSHISVFQAFSGNLLGFTLISYQELGFGSWSAFRVQLGEPWDSFSIYITRLTMVLVASCRRLPVGKLIMGKRQLLPFRNGISRLKTLVPSGTIWYHLVP